MQILALFGSILSANQQVELRPLFGYIADVGWSGNWGCF
jgi:hypothetical protein